MTASLSFIGLSPRPKAKILAPDRVFVHEGKGLEGDHRARRQGRGKRQVTVIAMEGLSVIGERMGASVQPKQLRRNLGISGLDWEPRKGSRLQLGEVMLELTDICEPCLRMEETIGEGGMEAVGSWGGWTFRVLHGGWLSLGMEIQCLDPWEETRT